MNEPDQHGVNSYTPWTHAHDWPFDIHDMHEVMGQTKWVEDNKNNPEVLKKWLMFRAKFLEEEFKETMLAHEEGNAEKMVDGLIDLCVIAIGTLDLFGVNPSVAWDEVHRANMKKVPGVNPDRRPNPLGVPDLVKPEGWKGPDHTNNHGMLDELFADDLS